MSLSEDGERLALVGESPSHPPEVYTMAHGDAAPRRLTDSNPWLASVDLAPQEVFRHEARDGLDLSGVLIRPAGDSEGPAPLILFVHGGPEGHRREWLADQVLGARPGRRGAGIRRVLPQLPRQHRARRRVFEAGPERCRRQGVRRPDRCGRCAGGGGHRRQRQGRGHRRFLRRLCDRLARDPLQRSLQGRV